MKIVIVILAIVALWKVSAGIVHSANREGERVDACIFNPAYQGDTPEATRYLYERCKANH